MATLGPDSEYRGIGLVGESGVGKSTLARALGARLAEAGRNVRSVLGTQTGRDVPLGAFSRSVTVDMAPEPAAMLQVAHKNIAAMNNPVVIVDDAHLLDPLSATLVYQMAAERTAQLIVVVPSGATLLDAVTALFKERLLLNLHIGRFTREQTAELTCRVLGGVVSPAMISDLHNRSAGNPLYLSGILRAGRESGLLVHDDDGWQIKGALQADQELSDLIEFRLQALNPKELEALQILATAELLDWEVFRELCSVEAVSALEHHRLIRLVSDGAGTVAQVTYPLLGEAVLERAGVARSRQLNGVLCQAFNKYLQESGSRLQIPDLRGRIRMAQFMIHSDLKPDLDLILNAAVDAAAMSNLSHAEELARFAFDRGGGLPAALVLGEVLVWQGRGQDAEAVLAQVNLDGADDTSLVLWACTRALNLFWNCGETESGRRILAEVRDRARGASAATVEALELAFAFFTGDITATIRSGPPLCEAHVPAIATALTALPTAHALAKAGQFGATATIAQAGLQAAANSHAGMVRFGIGIAEVMALVTAGDLPTAERVAERYTTMAAGIPEPDAMAKLLSGLVHLAGGRLPLACSLFQDSARVLSSAAPKLWPMLANAWATHAQAARGNAATAASAALRRCEEVYGPQIAAFLPELELARAWERVAHGQTSDGRVHALRAAQVARRSGMLAVEMRALHTAVRFGDRTQADRLTELAQALDAPLPDAVAAHARGLANRDADLLSTTSDRFAAMGASALAADAAAQASLEYGHAGERGKQLESATRARRLAGQGDIHTPAVEAVSQPLPITDREREIAALVAAGLSNRKIADRLSVSVRTVDGHLYRIFAKLGIERRDELVRLLSRPQAGT